MFGGIKFIVDDVVMSEEVEDWSDVRSPSRAARRRKRGFPQRIRMIRVAKRHGLNIGDRVIIHSETLALLRAKIGENENVRT